MSRFDPLPLLGGVVLLSLWEAGARLSGVATYLVPPPSAVAQALVKGSPSLLPAAGVTLSLALTALLIAAALGLGLAVLFRRAPWMERAFAPYALVLQATPIIAIAPLVVIWAGVESPRRAIVILGVIAAFFPVLASALAGLKAIDPGLDRLFRLYGASHWDRFVRLELPSMAPYLLSGLRTAAALSLVGSVAAEFVAGTGATGGLAWRILEAGNRLETAAMFAALALLAAMGVAFAAVFNVLEKRLT